MTHNTDERRAREITRLNMARLVKDISAEAAWDQASINMRADANLIARAIRASDEKAGMALVPRAATEEMSNAGWIDKEDVSPAEIWRAMIAATEAQE